jgi:8-oxo-dGTP pyrophosphatase MutT (NUDIX family)
MAQMYKVFIENKAVIFKINPNYKNKYSTKKEIWEKIDWLMTSKVDGIIFEIKNDTQFWNIFKKHIYIEAAGGLVERDGEFLFIKRNGFWDIPKGKIQKNEKIKTAAIREIEEECGLKKPKIKNHLINTWHTYEMNDQIYLKRTYWFWLKEGKKKTTLVPQGEEGITKVKYLPLSKFEKIRKNTYQSIIDVMDTLIKVRISK